MDGLIVEILTPGFLEESGGVLEEKFVEILDDLGTLDEIGMHDGAFINPLVKETAHFHDVGFKVFAAFESHLLFPPKCAPDDAAHHGVDAVGHAYGRGGL